MDIGVPIKKKKRRRRGSTKVSSSSDEQLSRMNLRCFEGSPEAFLQRLKEGSDERRLGEDLLPWSGQFGNKLVFLILPSVLKSFSSTGLENAICKVASLLGLKRTDVEFRRELATTLGLTPPRKDRSVSESDLCHALKKRMEESHGREASPAAEHSTAPDPASEPAQADSPRWYQWSNAQAVAWYLLALLFFILVILVALPDRSPHAFQDRPILGQQPRPPDQGSRLEGGGHQPILPSAEELIQFTKWVHCVPRLEWSLDDFLHLSTASAWASSALRLLSAPPAAAPHSFQQVAADWVLWLTTGADDLMLWPFAEDPRHWVAEAATAAQLPPMPPTGEWKHWAGRCLDIVGNQVSEWLLGAPSSDLRNDNDIADDCNADALHGPANPSYPPSPPQGTYLLEGTDLDWGQQWSLGAPSTDLRNDYVTDDDLMAFASSLLS